MGDDTGEAQIEERSAGDVPERTVAPEPGEVAHPVAPPDRVVAILERIPRKAEIGLGPGAAGAFGGNGWVDHRGRSRAWLRLWALPDPPRRGFASPTLRRLTVARRRDNPASDLVGRPVAGSASGMFSVPC